MGGTLSNFLGRPPEKDSSSESSPVMTFDSSKSWKAIEPFLKKMSDKIIRVKFAQIDVDKLSDVGQWFEVQAMPTFVFLKRGKEYNRIVGANTDELEKRWSNLQRLS